MKSVKSLLLLVIFISTQLFSQIPEVINYQGYLTDLSSAAIGDGMYNLTFRLYDVNAGGAAIWTESKGIEVIDGIFSTKLGDATPLAIPFSQPYWLSIQVETEPEFDPRIELTSSAYSFNSMSTETIKGMAVASTAPSNGQVLKWNGAEWEAAADAAGSSFWGINGNDIYYDQGYVGIGTSTPGAGLEVKSAAGYGSAVALSNTGGGIEWDLVSWTDGTFRLVKSTGTTFSPIVVEPVNGFVGIGTSTPDQLLSVHTSSGISYIRVSDNTTGPASGLRMGLSGSGNAYIINDESTKSLSLGTNGTTQLRIDDLGYVGINVIAPGQLLHLKQTLSNKGLRIEHNSATDYWENGVGVTTKNYKFYYNNLFRADISSTDGAYTQSSDRRLKQDIEDMSSVLNKVNQLKPTTFHYIDYAGSGPKSTGFIAQDVEPLFPDLVRETDDGYKGLVYDGFAVIAIKAIQEQQKIIEDLQKRIEELENK
jgi:endosialidase-like protein